MPYDQFIYPEVRGMSLRDRKILLLQEQQKRLKSTGSTAHDLRFQQRVLREKLLGKKPERKIDKVMRIRDEARLIKDLEEKEKRRRRRGREIVEEYAKPGERGKITGIIKSRERKNVGRGIPF